MRKLISLLICLSALFTLPAQVKIGAPGDPDINAVLELAGTSKGLLLPRIALTGTTSPAPLSAHIPGMVVYNTVTSSDVKPGYYCNDGTKWIRITTSQETWALTGNLGTNPVLDFIGTSDSTDLKIRTKNLDRIRIAAAGWVEIGTSLLPNSVRLKIAGSATGDGAAGLGLDPNISATADNQVLYSFRNNPIFGTSFDPLQVYGSATEFSYSGRAQNFLAASWNSVQTAGANSYPNIVAGVYGNASRSSSGASDGNFYGGYFRAQSSGGSGIATELFGLLGHASLSGSSALSLSYLGGLANIVSNFNPNATVLSLYGIRNAISQSAATTIAAAYGFQNTITASAGNITDAYGSLVSFNTNSFGTITNAFGHYISPISSSTSVASYRAIFVGNITVPVGLRRVFEYGGTGINEPFIINADGSVMIGNTTPVSGAKLSIHNGHIQSSQTSKPLISAGAPIGTGGTASLNDATDMAGSITIDLGTGAWGTGVIVTVSFSRAYTNPPIVIITPTNANAALGVINQRPYVAATTVTFSIVFQAAATNGNAMTFNYHVIETVNN